jgi:PHD/YefM family antitoxin component YafN of YafNO toxin-antitoxin module
VSLPHEVQSVGELREHLAEAMTAVRQPGGHPVFVGRHRRREAVLMSVERYEQLLEGERRTAIADALGSVRAEGFEPSPLGHDVLERMAVGTLDVEEATALLVAHYQR